MLTRNKQKKYLNKRWKQSFRHLDCFAEKRSEESLHKLRVELKKIKAFRQFSKACYHKEYRPEKFRAIKEIFREAGVIRDASSRLTLLKKYRFAASSAGENQEYLLEQASDKFISRANAFREKMGKARKSFQSSIQPVKNDCITDWYSRELTGIALAFLSSDPGKFHESRKQIKNLVYLYSIIPGSAASGILLDKSYLDRLQDCIGKWHDILTMQDILKAKGFSDASLKLQAESQKLENSIRKMTGNFHEKALAGR